MRMKTKNLFCAAVLLAYLFVGCSDGSDDNIGAPVVPEPETPAEPEIFRTAFECKTFAEALDTDFDEFKTAYGKFVLPENRTEQAAGRLSLGGYLKTPTGQRAASDNRLGKCRRKVEAIEAAAEDASLGRSLWEYFLTDSETLGLGSFLGTKYKGKTEGGVFQTIEETLQYVAANGMDDLRMCTLFGVVPGKAYAVPTIDRNGVKVELMKNYLPIDHSGRAAGSEGATTILQTAITSSATKYRSGETTTSTSTMHSTKPETSFPQSSIPTRICNRSPTSFSTSPMKSTTRRPN